MLEPPKGIKYWIDTPEGTKIDDNAPEWAKEEFQEYQDMMNAKPDKNGIITEY